MLRHVARNRAVAEGGTLRVYSEVYGLMTERSRARYRVTYSLLRSDDPERDLDRDEWAGTGAVTQAFDREAVPSSLGLVREVLDVSPERLARGSYVMRLEVQDLVSGTSAGRSQVSFTVR